MVYTDTVAPVTPSKRYQTTLWTVQILLALLFTMTGAMKATQPIASLAASLGWPAVVPPALVRLIGIAELLGAAGLILPAATRIAPWLTPLAALGLTIVMLLASVVHITRGELAIVPVPVVTGLLAAFVGWGRWRKAPVVSG